MDKQLLDFVNEQTGIEHFHVIDMLDSEKNGNCFIFVSCFDYNGTQRYVKRFNSNKDNWYMIEISYEEYCFWLAHSQFQLFKKMNKITGSTSELDIESMIEDATKRLQRHQAIDAEMQDLPEEDLVDEETFRRMMGD